jgi:AbrB family looped-hinge helix DNA binding protein
MAKVTSKLQLTIPKAIASRYGIRPGDDLKWLPSGEGIRVETTRPGPSAHDALTREERLQLFDRAMERQDSRIKEMRHDAMAKPAIGRGWTREELYDRDRSR